MQNLVGVMLILISIAFRTGLIKKKCIMGIIKGFKAFILTTVNDNRVIIIRLIIGLVFLSEGIQKYLFP